MSPKLSVVINAQDVEDLIALPISSVKGLADEVVVIDQNSKDETASIAKKLGAKVFNHKRVDCVELARNFALSKAMGDWVLVLDPDEEIPAKLAKKIKEIIKHPKADYYRLPRKNIVFGKWLKHSRWWPDYNIRLFKKGCVSWNEIIHSVPMTTGKGKELDAKEELAIIHHHYDSISQYLERMGRYTLIQAKLKIKEGYKFNWKDLIKKPFAEFLSRYFFGEGYKDGVHGLALAMLQSFSELVLYLHIWQHEKYSDSNPSLKKVVKLMKKHEKDLHYWQNDSLYRETKKLKYRVKRKLGI